MGNPRCAWSMHTYDRVLFPFLAEWGMAMSSDGCSGVVNFEVIKRKALQSEHLWYQYTLENMEL
jgi:hypothetical protein